MASCEDVGIFTLKWGEWADSHLSLFIESTARISYMDNILPCPLVLQPISNYAAKEEAYITTIAH